MSHGSKLVLLNLIVVALGLVFGLWIPPAEASSSRDVCVKQPPRVILTLTDTSVAYDFSRSREELQNMGQNSLQVPTGKMHVTGLTSANLSYGLKSEFMIMKLRSGQVCLQPREIKATVGYDSMIVYVDKRYRQGSCQHRIVLQHEHEHVRIHQSFLRQYAPRIDQTLRSAAVRVFPVIAATEEEAKARAMKAMSDALSGALHEMQTMRDVSHARIDMPESYARTRKMCPSW